MLRRSGPNGLIAAALLGIADRSSAAVTVTGVEGETLENVQQYVTNEPSCDANAALVRQYAEQLQIDLRPALEAFGYYDAAITAQVAEPTPECWHVRLTIAPGAPTTVANVSVALLGEARDDAAMTGLVDAFPLEPGSTLRHGDYRAFKGRLEALANERGYVEGRFTDERVDVYVERSDADIRLTYDSGPRYTFGNVTFATDALSERVLQSFATFAPGEPYDAAAVAQLQRELAGAEYFARVNVVPELDAARDLRIPIRVEATPARPTSYSVGGGFSTDDGPRFSFSYRNVLRNRAGHQLDGDLLLAGVRQNASFEYRVPIGNPQRDWLSYRAGIAREDIDAGVGSAARAGVRHTRVADAFTHTRFIDVLFERDQIGGESLSTRLLLPGLSWVRSYRDDFARPREGHRVSLSVMLGVGDLALLQGDARGKWIRATPWDARIITRARVSSTLHDESFSQLPLSMRLFAGGDNSVRGYDFNSLGPRNPAGELIGGNRLIEASIEYEHPVRPDWSVAIFADAGNAFLGDDFDARVGAGIGARWFSPIGPIRIDVAWPRDAGAGDNRSPELHISLGPDL
jgi:translocation and assembly module TamA